MNDRPNDLLNIRPEIKKTIAFDSMTSDGTFSERNFTSHIKVTKPFISLCVY